MYQLNSQPLPAWALALLIALTFAAEVLGDEIQAWRQPTILMNVCVDLCQGRLRRWDGYSCECQEAE